MPQPADPQNEKRTVREPTGDLPTPHSRVTHYVTANAQSADQFTVGQNRSLKHTSKSDSLPSLDPDRSEIVAGVASLSFHTDATREAMDLCK